MARCVKQRPLRRLLCLEYIKFSFHEKWNNCPQRSFVRSFVRSFDRSSFVRRFVRSFVRSFVCSFIRSFVGSLICSFVSFVRSCVRSFVCAFSISITYFQFQFLYINLEFMFILRKSYQKYSFFWSLIFNNFDIRYVIS